MEVDSSDIAVVAGYSVTISGKYQCSVGRRRWWWWCRWGGERGRYGRGIGAVVAVCCHPSPFTHHHDHVSSSSCNSPPCLTRCPPSTPSRPSRPHGRRWKRLPNPTPDCIPHKVAQEVDEGLRFYQSDEQYPLYRFPIVMDVVTPLLATTTVAVLLPLLDNGFLTPLTATASVCTSK